MNPYVVVRVTYHVCHEHVVLGPGGGFAVHGGAVCQGCAHVGLTLIGCVGDWAPLGLVCVVVHENHSRDWDRRGSVKYSRAELNGYTTDLSYSPNYGVKVAGAYIALAAPIMCFG